MLFGPVVNPQVVPVIPSVDVHDAKTNTNYVQEGYGAGKQIQDQTRYGTQFMSDVDQLYMINREWAEEQAQKQMDYQTSANKIAMDFSSAEADKERAFQTEMANSAYQRAVQDLKKAGLNPILAYSQGGASVPSVSSATGVTSSGAKATMTDTGYTSHQLDYARLKLAVNSAVSLINTQTQASAQVASSIIKSVSPF